MSSGRTTEQTSGPRWCPTPVRCLADLHELVNLPEWAEADRLMTAIKPAGGRESDVQPGVRVRTPGSSFLRLAVDEEQELTGHHRLSMPSSAQHAWIEDLQLAVAFLLFLVDVHTGHRPIQRTTMAKGPPEDNPDLVRGEAPFPEVDMLRSKVLNGHSAFQRGSWCRIQPLSSRRM